MQSNNTHAVKVNKSWYVETRTGFDGPFESEEEASNYWFLLETNEAARVEFAGLQYTPQNVGI